MFAHAHATHPDWRMALALAAAQIDAQLAARATARGSEPTQGEVDEAPPLGLVYFSDRYVVEAEELNDDLHARWPDTVWVGAASFGVVATGVEYIDEPALVIMMCDVPRERFAVFSGARPLSAVSTGGQRAWSALVHADGQVPELPAVLAELADRTETGYLFGGLVAARGRAVQLAEGVWEGGLSGVAFSREVEVVSRVTQGCQPVAPTRRITAAQDHVVLALDGQPALDVLLADLGIDLGSPRQAVPVLRGTLVGLIQPGQDMLVRRGQFGTDVQVRHLIGLDPSRQGFAVAGHVEPGMQLALCKRDREAARLDLVRACSEVREAVSSDDDNPTAPPRRRIAGALYVSCSGRGGPHFGAPGAELEIVRHALGDVPLVGFFAGGEIARHHLYGYTGVLTVFTEPVPLPSDGAKLP